MAKTSSKSVKKSLSPQPDASVHDAQKPDSRLDLRDELMAIQRMVDCFSQLFLLISCQSEPLDSKVLGTISTFLYDIKTRIQKVEERL